VSDIIGRLFQDLQQFWIRFARRIFQSYFHFNPLSWAGHIRSHVFDRIGLDQRKQGRRRKVMSQVRFGEFLGRLVHLSRHDVDEILEEQCSTKHRFGEIALSWGLCAPEHVWQAWCDQLLSQVQMVDLEKLGVDSQATTLIRGELARRLNVIPIRCMGQQLIVAVPSKDTDHIAGELRKITDMQLRFVVADLNQIAQAIGVYYAPAHAAA
jgi:hypothetical protein